MHLGKQRSQENFLQIKPLTLTRERPSEEVKFSVGSVVAGGLREDKSETIDRLQIMKGVKCLLKSGTRCKAFIVRTILTARKPARHGNKSDVNELESRLGTAASLENCEEGRRW